MFYSDIIDMIFYVSDVIYNEKINTIFIFSLLKITFKIVYLFI